MNDSTRTKRRSKGRHVKLFHRHNGRCFYCECGLVFHHDSLDADRRPNVITRDHLIPRSMGGTNAAENIVAACLSCNSRRGNMPWQDFLALVRRERGLDQPGSYISGPKASILPARHV